MRKREFVRSALAAAIAAAGPRSWAQAQFPAKPINFVVPFAAGGGGDVVARLVGKGLSERVNTPVVVDNRVGAGGNIGAAYVLRSAPDGYTLLNMSSTYAIQGAVGKPPFDPVADMQPVIVVSRDALVLVVEPGSPWRNAKDLAEAARAAPGKYTHGSAGIGSIAHLGMEELAFNMGVQLVHVPYKGSSQAFNDLLGKTLDMMLTSTTYAANFIKAGRVRALGIASAQRVPFLPDVPTFAEQGWPNYVLADWKAIGGPRGMPPEVVAFLNREINEVLKKDWVAEKFRAEGTTVVGGTPEQMAQLVRTDVERWRSLVRRANIKVE